MIKPSVLYRQAGDALQQPAYNPKKLVLLHTAVALGCSLLVTALDYLLNLQIAATGGLSDMGLRITLSTIQYILNLFVMVALPFWEIGLLFASLRWANGENATEKDLLQGFRRFGAILGIRLLQGVLFFLLGIVVSYISAAIFMLTPFAAPMIAIMEPILQSPAPEELITPELFAPVMDSFIPLLILFSVLFLAVAIPVFYRLRFSEFAVLEGNSATKALAHSIRLTRKKSLRLFKVDLHFWWFYLLQALCLVVCYADILLTKLGVSLPLSEDGSFFLFYVLGTVGQGVLLWLCQGRRLTTYALTYQAFDETPELSLPTAIVQDI